MESQLGQGQQQDASREVVSPLPLCDSSKPGHALASGSLSASIDCRSSGILVREESQQIVPRWRYSSGHVEGPRGPPSTGGVCRCGFMEKLHNNQVPTEVLYAYKVIFTTILFVLLLSPFYRRRN